MYRTLAHKGYAKSSNRHGCRLNPRDGTPMHVMVEYALQQLPGMFGDQLWQGPELDGMMQMTNAAWLIAPTMVMLCCCRA